MVVRRKVKEARKVLRKVKKHYLSVISEPINQRKVQVMSTSPAQEALVLNLNVPPQKHPAKKDTSPFLGIRRLVFQLDC